MIEMIQQTAWGHFFILISFAILLLIVLKWTWQQLQRILNRRQQQVSQSLHQAEAYQVESQQMKADLQSRGRSNLQEKIKKDHERLQEEVKEKRQAMDQHVHQELKRLQDQAWQQLVADRKMMEKEMAKDQVAALSVDVAEKFLSDRSNCRTIKTCLLILKMDRIKRGWIPTTMS